jgi:hypothetical protein
MGDVAMAGGRLRCLAALAALTRDDAVVREAGHALDAVECPPGEAWVTGADVYLLMGRPEPLDRATRGTWPALRTQTSSTSSRAARSAPSVGTGT